MTLLYGIKQRWNHPLLLAAWLNLRLQKIFKSGFDAQSSAADNKLALDVVIPTAGKDFNVLQACVKSLENVRQKVNKVFIVAKQDEAITGFCRQNGLQFVDETLVLGYGKERIGNYWVEKWDRSGWVLQQLIKLSADKFVTTENYLVVDSDTIMLRPISFFKNQKPIHYLSEEWQPEYFTSFEKMFGYKSASRLSFVSHMMVFNCEKLQQMKKEIEDRNGKAWDEVFLSCVDKSKMSPVSEYETYGNWLLKNFPGYQIFQPLYNRAMSTKSFTDYQDLKKKYSSKYQTVSFHSYL